MATSKFPEGTAAYYNDLIAQASNELIAIEKQLIPLKTRYLDWNRVKNSDSRNQALNGKWSCGKKVGCSDVDRAAIIGSEADYSAKTIERDLKVTEIAGYKSSLSAINAVAVSQTPAERTAAAETIRKAKANQNWLIFGLVVAILAGVGGFIYWRSKQS